MTAPPLAFGTLALTITVVITLLVLSLIGMVRARGNKNSTFLEWDPVDRTAWRGELDEADVFVMLDEHNRRREERGLPPQTMAEYTEGLAKG